MTDLDLNNVVWEWETAKDKWCRYDKEKIDLFTDACSNDQTHVEFETNDVKFDVIFAKLIQKNKETGFERRIRCAIVDENSGLFYVWQWLDERKKWQNYSHKISLDLEKEFQSKNLNSVSFVVAERSYSVDLSKMEQKNDVSGIIRKVQRIKSEAVENVEIPARQLRTSSLRKTKEEIDPKPPKIAKQTSKSRKAEDEKIEEKPLKREKSRRKNTDEDDEMPLIDVKKRVESKKNDDDESESKTTKRKRKIAVESDEEDEKPKEKKSAAKGGEGKSTIRTVVVKGKAPVDIECQRKLGKAHVFYEGNAIYDCMLNQTNVQNNNNKYYIIQLLEDDNSKQYSVWMRWGRVGFAGQNSLVACGPDLDQAKDVFCKKFFDKTKNEWCDRGKFKKVAGKYDLIEVDYAADGDKSKKDEKKESVKKKEEEKIPVASKLHEAVQKLLKLICDITAMESTVREMKYDADKMPLGKLTAAQIKAGFAALKKIETCLDRNSTGRDLVDACNEFYTRIPHCFGMKTPPLIRDRTMLKEKIKLLETLDDIEVAIRTLKSEDDDDEEQRKHPLDRHYKSMKCELKPLDRDAEMFQVVERYLTNTHASTHNLYMMKLINVFECDKDGEMGRFNDLGNKMLLWHGSRLTNWYGILSQGLRIAPPEAPVTGYMFGKGVYFADISSKSTNYCFATKQKNVGFAVLCEVSLGNAYDRTAADYNADKLPAGYNSTKGLGRVVPDPKDIYVTKDGCLVPYGKPKDTGPTSQTYTLNYNEYVVYDISQIKMKYLAEIEFVFP